ncbi:MAG: GDP-mannose 4,6-dehydratase [Candidatus Hadarchaeum sp.]|uniref:NAD-dependent epimerase/dehydratase family protein n=1 Tax=Candidatus Hadarchaeum sp. TaxID=2883567 RepID=UPI0031823319
MKVLVTGGAGFIGSNLVEELVRSGEDVIVLDDFSTGSLENLRAVEKQVQIVRASCQRLLELKLPEVKKIFHLGIPSSSPMYRDNPLLVGEAIRGFINVFELARRNRAKVVYASTSSLYRGCPTPHREDRISEPFDFYTEARIAMERLARVYHELYGIPSVGMRFFSVYGPHERAKGKYANNVSQFLWAMREDKSPEIYGDGEQTRDFVHVSDVVRACLKAANSDLGCEVINVGTGKQTSFNRVIELLNKALGKSINPIYVPNPVKNYVYHTCADLTKARKLLGYEPTVTLEEGIKRLVAVEG